MNLVISYIIILLKLELTGYITLMDPLTITESIKVVMRSI